MKQLATRRVAVSSLSLDPANTRAHDEKNLEAIKGSLRRFGQQKPIVVDAKGIVRAGNGTLEAARSLGWVEIDVVVSELSDAELVAFAIADNRTSELSEWNMDALKQTLGSLEDLDGIGFSEEDIAKLFPKDTSAMEDEPVGDPPVDAVTCPGDVWLLGEHRVMCGDSTKGEDVAKLYARHKPWMMLTDPPYGVNYDPKWRSTTSGLWTSGEYVNDGKVTNDDRVDWSSAWQLFPGDVAYVWHAGRRSHEVALQLATAELEIRSQIIWVKPRFIISRGHYHWQHEPCWYAVRAGATSRWCGDHSQSTTWNMGLTEGNDERTKHSTQKPVEAMARPMQNHGGAGDVVYDPFLGSGTTLVAAERLGRVCVAMEIDPSYVDLAVMRWEKLTGKLAIHEASGCTFAQYKDASVVSERLEMDAAARAS